MSLVARYELNDPATLTTDATGNGNTLTNVNSVGTTTDATYGTVASFVKSSLHYLSIASTPSSLTGSSSRTFSLWVRILSGHVGLLFGNGDDTSGTSYRLQYNDGPLLTFNDAVLVQINSPPVDQWAHIALTYDGNTEVMYVDGVSANSGIKTLNIPSGPLFIGNSVGVGTGATFNGQMLDFRAYDNALSPAEVSTLFSDGPNPAPPSVNWVLDGNSKYEISSKEHLIQLMNSGTAYANAGTTPTNWTTSSYIQTVDIDLEGDSTNIKPIGSPGPFQGEYDGNGFTISNWVYADPNYPSVSAASSEFNHIGLFGYIQGSAILKNIRMAGVCSLSGFRSTAGLLVGWSIQSSNVYNIELDLSPGSFIANSTGSSSSTTIGGMIGALSNTGTNVGLTLKGELTLTPSPSASSLRIGGMIGDMVSCSGTLFRNLATFPSPIEGAKAGGIVGRLYRSSLTKVLNAMTGDITETTGGSFVGGIAGEVSQNNTAQESSEYVNSMKGKITGTTTNSYNGGIFGRLDQEAGATIHSLFNYMGGEITNTFNADRVGGLVATGDANTNIATSINAMNGFVRMPTTGNPSSGAEANVDTSFGLTYDVERNIAATPITGLPTDTETGLPIFDLVATDPDGVVHTFEFVFGNGPRSFNQLQIKANEFLNMSELEVYNLNGENIALLGTASSDADLGGGQESRGIDGNSDHDFSSGTVMDLYKSGGPTWILDLDREYTLSEINKVVFYNRSGTVEPARAIGATISFYSADGGDPEQIGVLTADLIQEFVITSVPFTVAPRALSVNITVSPVDGATAYRLTSQRTTGPSSTELVAVSSFTDLNQTIPNLTPETEYTFRLYSTTGNSYVLVHEATVTTLVNSASNYDANDFLVESGRFDLSSLNTASVGLIADVMNDLFTTGDSIDINVPGGRSGATVSTFVNTGGNVNIENSEAIVAPFSTDAGAGQSVSLTLSDSSVVALSYDETTEAITVGATTYTSGESFVLDGKKATIVDI